MGTDAPRRRLTRAESKALFDGLVRQRRIDPGQVPEDLFGHALRWLFEGVEATGEGVLAGRRTRVAETAG